MVNVKFNLMEKGIFFGLCMLLLITCIPSTYVTSNTSQGLVAYYKLDETSGNAIDSSGYGNTGTINGGIIQGVAGVVNNSYNFDGSTGYIEVPRSSSIEPTSAITLSAWVYPVMSNDYSVIIDKPYTSHVLPFYSYHLDIMYNNTTHLPKQLDFLGSLDGQYQHLGEYPFTDINSWHLITATYDGSVAKVYVDGVLIGSNYFLGSISYYNTNLFIGKFRNLDKGYFQGKIDDVRIYNRALSQSEITDLYNQNTSGLDNFSNWKFDEYTGNAVDSSNNGNNGAIHGGVTQGLPGVLGLSYGFDGKTGYVEVNKNASLEPTNGITLSAWVYPVVSSDYSVIIDKPYTSHVLPFYSYHLDIMYNNTTHLPKQLDFLGSLDGQYQHLGQVSFSSVNAWNLIIATYNGTTANLYVNGSLVSSNQFYGSITYYNTDLYIGRFRNLNNGFFNGKIDDVRIYNYAFSALDVYTLLVSYLNDSSSIFNINKILSSLSNLTTPNGFSLPFNLPFDSNFALISLITLVIINKKFRVKKSDIK